MILLVNHEVINHLPWEMGYLLSALPEVLTWCSVEIILTIHVCGC
jgi:hypothetical protein